MSAKIAFVTPTISRAGGGLFYSVRALAENIQRVGRSVEVYAIEDNHSEQDKAEWQVPVRIYRPLLARSLKVNPLLGADLQVGGHSVIHSTGLWTYCSVAAAAAARRIGAPHIISPRGMLDPWALGSKKFKKLVAGGLFQRGVIRTAACVHALTDTEADAIRLYGFRGPIAVIPNGVNLPAGRDNHRTTGKKQLLFLGRLNRKKGIEETLLAWSILSERDPKLIQSWEFLIAGLDEGGYERELKGLVAEKGVPGVKFIGPQFGEAKERVLRGADAFILASYSEGLPMALLEAWSYGLPSFATRQCNIPEGFAAGAAVQITVSPAEIAGTLGAWLNSSDLGIVGARAREFIRTYEWQSLAIQMVAVYDWLGGIGAKPTFVHTANS